MTVSQSVEHYRLRRQALALGRFTVSELTAVAGVSHATTHNFLSQLRHQTPALVEERQTAREGVGRPPIRYALTPDGVRWLSERNLTLASQLNAAAFHQDSTLEPRLDPAEGSAGTSRGIAVSPSFVPAFGRIFAEFQKAIEQHASALYLKAGQPTLLRVNEQMQLLGGSHVWSVDELSRLAADLLTPWQTQRFNARGSLACAYHAHSDPAIALRLFREGGTVGLEIRRAPARVPSVADLNLQATHVAQFCASRVGFVFVSGPIGSGRIRALAAMTDHINADRAVRIVTIDEPTIFRHTNKKSDISQRQVGVDTPDFWTGVRDALKESIDVLVISDLNDHRTVEMALDASKRVLVMCRVDAPDIAEAVETLVGQLPADERNRGRRMLAEQLIGGISLSSQSWRGGESHPGAVTIVEANDDIRALVVDPERTALLRNVGDGATGNIRVTLAYEDLAR